MADEDLPAKSGMAVEELKKKVPPAHHATEFLANERTFLAWVRTSIAVISLGFVVTKFDIWIKELAARSGTSAFRGIGWTIPMGLSLIAFGGVLAILAAWRYHAVNRQIETGAVKADRGLIVLITLLIVILALVFIIYFIKSEG